MLQRLKNDYFTILLLEIPIRFERLFFIAGLLVALVPIWSSGHYFVTGDGPCHTYNAAVLLDWWRGHHTVIYNEFYELNQHFDPNWWSHAWLMILQTVAPPNLAEKLFLSAYVLAFGFGIRYWLRQMRYEAMFLSSVGLLFCWHHLLMQGFFNYAWSIAAMFWLTGYWLQCRPLITVRQGIVLAIGWVMLYSMHPIGLAASGIAIGCNVLTEWLIGSRIEGWKVYTRLIAKRTLAALLTATPALILTIQYLLRKNWEHAGNDLIVKDLIDNLVTLSGLTLLNRSEHSLTNPVVFLMIGLLLVALWSRVRSREPNAGDFWLLFIGIFIWLYLSQAGAQAVELMLPQRLQLLPWLGLLGWLACATFPNWVRRLTPLIALSLMVLLVWHRLPAHRAASDLAAEYTSVADAIQPPGTLMVINYDFNGKDAHGKPIGDAIWLFNHVADYIGAEKPGLVMSDNYEASLQYFPLIWHYQKNLYTQTTLDGAGFEDRPPTVDLLNYPRRSEGSQIDYVLILDQSPADRTHPRGISLMQQLDSGYTPIDSSGRARLWKRR